MTNECDHGQLKRVCRECELEAEIEALRAKLADCQAVIRHKGHDADCPKMLCGRCGYGAYGHWERFPPHVMVESSDPCSDACGHDRTTGEKA